MISFILALIIAAIYSYNSAEPSLLIAAIITMGVWSYFRLAIYTATLIVVMRVIMSDSKLQEDFKAAGKKQYED